MSDEGFTTGCNVISPMVATTILNDTIITEPVSDSTINITSLPFTYVPPVFGTEITYCSSVGENEIFAHAWLLVVDLNCHIDVSG